MDDHSRRKMNQFGIFAKERSQPFSVSLTVNGEDNWPGPVHERFVRCSLSPRGENPVLDPQLAEVAEVGEEDRRAVGELRFRVPFFASAVERRPCTFDGASVIMYSIIEPERYHGIEENRLRPSVEAVRTQGRGVIIQIVAIMAHTG